MAQTKLGEAVDGILERLVVLEPLALPRTVHAVKHFFHTQSTHPYWVHRLEGIEPRERSGNQVLSYELRLMLRLVYEDLTADWTGAIEEGAVVEAADVVAFFDSHHRLAVESDPALRQPPRWVGPRGLTISAGPLGVYPLYDTLKHLGIEFRLTVPITVGP
jgi:hypothetical protein